MNKLFLGKVLLALVFVLPAQALAAVNVDVSISLPPPIVFAAPPALVVLPETYIYVVPDAEVDIFFYDGWWWRPWQGRWYRSHSYSSGWGYYRSVPSFYRQIPSTWRNDYREHRWRGHQWDYRPIPHHEVQQNWKGWKKDKHWEKQNTWGVRDLKPRTQARQQPPAVEAQHQGKTKVQGPAGQREPGSREIREQQTQPRSQGKQEVREPAKPQQSRPQSPEVRQPREQPQQREGQQSKPQQGRPDRGQENKPDGRHGDK